MNDNFSTQNVERLADHIEGFLDGEPDMVCGACLAELLSRLLRRQLAQYREDLLRIHMTAVRELMKLP
jgi:hypothetical protein